MKKGITPVIALVMLMLITVGMVGIAYSWFSGLLTTQTEKGITIPPGGTYCAAGLISVLIQNNGATSSLLTDNVIITQVDGADVNNVVGVGVAGKQDLGASGLAPGSGALIVKNWPCTGGLQSGSVCSSGSHTIRIGTRTGVVESTAYCK